MTDKTISYSLRNCDISKGKVVREVDSLKAILITKRIREPIWTNKERKSCSKVYNCLVLLCNDKKVGMIVRFPRSDVHLFIFEKYRDKRYMSRLIDNGLLKQLWSDIDECHIVNMEEFNRIEHLLHIAGFSVCEESYKEYEEYQRRYL